ncbi:MAG: hypothetical protein AB7U85_09185 [Alphaproteobacteria bacterium]
MNINQGKTNLNNPQDFYLGLLSFPFNNLEESNINDSGEALVNIFNLFHELNDNNKLYNLYINIIKNLKIETDSPAYQVGATIAKKIDNKLYSQKNNKYHNMQHTAEVMLTSYHLSLLNNALKLDYNFTNYEIGLIVLAALLHDVNHDGSNNQNIPFRLEEQSLHIVEHDLKKLSKEDREAIHALVLSTDIFSFPAFVKKYYLNRDKLNILSDIPETFKELRLFLTNERAFAMSQILRDADVLPSTGLSVKKTTALSQNLYKEQMNTNQTPDIKTITENFVNFANTFLKNGFNSKAGKLYNDKLKEIVKQLEN